MSFSLYTSLFTLLCLLGLSHAAGLGQWGQTIQFPMVPVAASVIPSNGKLLVWSAYSNNAFATDRSGMTKTATYDPATGTVSALSVSNTNHDMFCPGISMDFDGRLVVTGGDTANRTSIYDPSSNTWIAGPTMKIPRGYQSSTTTSEGKIFTIGGSWSGGYGNKNGEIYDPSTNTWSLLSGATVSQMLTADKQGAFRSDNHAWLFGWTGGSVFQAGPSKTMNWYSTVGSGSVKNAGTRGTDPDAMDAVVVMYDAVAGKIFSAGGSPSYQDSDATRNAQTITIGTPNTLPTVTTLNKLWYARAFASAVVLPDGKVFIVGGQSYAVPFSDGNSSLVTEMWDPSTTRFVKMASLSTPRNYHSVAVLMPDGTVFSGGGGLCGTCTTNHFDGQMYSPPYLFGSDGVTPVSRPIIASISTSTVAVGTAMTAILDSSVPNATATFSLIRMGSNTHTVNTDQRRIPLTPTAVNGSTYTLAIPSDAGKALPGYWYLFAIVGGVPSVAKIVKVTL